MQFSDVHLPRFPIQVSIYIHMYVRLSEFCHYQSAQAWAGTSSTLSCQGSGTVLGGAFWCQKFTSKEALKFHSTLDSDLSKNPDVLHSSPHCSKTD